MKKIALLLALILLLSTVFTACKDTSANDTSSEVISEDESSASADESEENKTPVYETASYCTNISLGCGYTSNPAADPNYEDSYGIELTDGMYAADIETSYTDAALSGYSSSTSSASFIIDLGSTYDNIYHFEASYLCYDGTAGIKAPQKIAIYTSEDNEKFDYRGKITMSYGASASTAKGVLETKQYVTARYIKFVVFKDAAWFFLDELSVFADVEGSDSANEFISLLDGAYNADSTTSASRLEALNAVAGDEIDYSAKKQLISSGCKYTCSSASISTYPDTGVTMLTDGKQCGYFAGETWAGFKGNKDQSFVLDLGKNRSDIAEFTASLYANSGLGNYFPLTMTVSVSSDNKDFTEIGKVYACDDVTQSAYVYRLVLSKAVSARYIKYDFANSNCDLMMIEELGVYAYTNDTSESQLYPDVVFDGSELRNWPSSSDASKKQNLLLGLPQQILAGSAIEKSCYQYNTAVTAKTLTDGVFSANGNIHNGQFFKFNRGSKRTIFYDFGYLTSIETVKAGFLSYKEQAVTAPGVLTVLMSEDGKNWYKAAVISISTDKDQQTIRVEYTFAKPIATRYIAYQFEVQTWAGCDELEAIGTKKVPSNAVRLTKSNLDIVPVIYNEYQTAEPDLLGGVSDITLMYHGVNYDNTVEKLLPYVAYVDSDGNIKDTMFDGFLFLLTQSFPSGAAGHKESKKSDWEWCLNDLFAEGENIDALNTVAGQVNEALGLDKKYSFYVTLYVPHIKQKSFGDVDGDGVSEDLSVYENRIKVLNWYMDEFEKRFAESGYDNLSFEGYYWYNESVYVSEDSDIVKLLNDTSDSIHNRGYDFFWIPYYNASGFSDWYSYGFDTACMQPNYAFKESVIESRLDEAVNLIKKYHMSLEMEIDGMALSNSVYYDKYMGYLSHGVTDGYMTESMHMYYQSTDIYYKAAYSSNQKNRLIYDYTYQFIKGTLDISPDAVDTIELTTAKETSVKSAVKIQDAKSYTVAVSPEHGTVSMNNNGTFTYYPDKGYTGTDTFAYTYNLGLGESALCYVTVNVN